MKDLDGGGGDRNRCHKEKVTVHGGKTAFLGHCEAFRPKQSQIDIKRPKFSILARERLQEKEAKIKQKGVT
jgi:hypothetical protein